MIAIVVGPGFFAFIVLIQCTGLYRNPSGRTPRPKDETRFKEGGKATGARERQRSVKEQGKGSSDRGRRTTSLKQALVTPRHLNTERDGGQRYITTLAHDRTGGLKRANEAFFSGIERRITRTANKVCEAGLTPVVLRQQLTVDEELGGLDLTFEKGSPVTSFLLCVQIGSLFKRLNDGIARKISDNNGCLGDKFFPRRTEGE